MKTSCAFANILSNNFIDNHIIHNYIINCKKMLTTKYESIMQEKYVKIYVLNIKVDSLLVEYNIRKNIKK